MDKYMRKLVAMTVAVLMIAMIGTAAADQRVIGEVVRISEKHNTTIIDGGLLRFEWRIPGTTEYTVGQFVDVLVDDDMEIIEVQPLNLSPESLYSELFRVVRITYYRCKVTVVNGSGTEFPLWMEDHDLEVGDYITAVMYDGGTDDINDDSIISVRRERLYLL